MNSANMSARSVFRAPQTIPYDDAYLISLQLRTSPDFDQFFDDRYVRPKNFEAGTTSFYDLRSHPPEEASAVVAAPGARPFCEVESVVQPFSRRSMSCSCTCASSALSKIWGATPRRFSAWPSFIRRNALVV